MEKVSSPKRRSTLASSASLRKRLESYTPERIAEFKKSDAELAPIAELLRKKSDSSK